MTTEYPFQGYDSIVNGDFGIPLINRVIPLNHFNLDMYASMVFQKIKILDMMQFAVYHLNQWLEDILSLPAPHGNPVLGLVLLGIALGILLILDGLFAALFIVMIDGGGGFAAFLILVGLAGIFGYIALVIRVRRARRRARREQQQKEHLSQ